MLDGKIIDIRSEYKYSLGHIPNAFNIPMVNLINETEKYLNKDEKYYIYCQSGSSSKSVVYMLNNKGYNTINVDGGYNYYINNKKDV